MKKAKSGLLQSTVLSIAAISIMLTGSMSSSASEGEEISEFSGFPQAEIIPQIVVPALVLSFAKGAMDKLKS